MPWSYLVLALLLVAGVILLLSAIAVAATLLVLRPPRMTDGKAIVCLKRLSPGDLDLPFENVRFEVKDDFSGGMIPLAGWWIGAEAPSDRCVILLHGYSDAKVGGIAWAPMWRSLGFNVLAVDLRAHGESGGRYCTAGWYERRDISRVIDQLRQDRPRQCRHIVLFGASLGAAVAAATAAMRDDIDAIVMDCPYADFARAAATHACVWGMPRGRMTGWVMSLAQRIGHADFNAVRPVDLIEQVRCPVMVIRCERDFLVDSADAAEIELAVTRREAVGHDAVYWSIPEAGHILGLAVRPEEYTRRIGAFVDQAMEQDGGGAGVADSDLMKASPP